MSGKIKELLQQPKYAAVWTLIKTGLALTLVFAIFLNVDKTLGWFSNNTEVEATGMAVNVSGPEGVVESVEYFKISAISSVISNGQSYNVYEFAATDAIDKANAKLETFSELIALRQIMLKVTLKSDLEGARIYATTNTQKYITEGTIAASGNPLSSVVDIRVATEATIESGTYKISDENTKVLRFAELDATDGVGFTLTQQTDTITINDLDESAQCIYIIIDYYEESTAYVMDVVNALLMEDRIELGTNSQIDFVCDFTICIS